MDETEEQSFEERLRSLEAAVHGLQETVSALERALPRGGSTGTSRTQGSSKPRVRELASDPGPDGLSAASARRRPRPRAGHRPNTPSPLAGLVDRGPQYWISRAGIALVLMGVVFVFKYAVDQGWLTPEIRVAFGLALGGALAVIGFRVHMQKGWFSRLMLGGAAAAWYITGFAAYQLLHVVGHPVAFAFMVLVTAFTFLASVKEDEPGLAVLGALGGLGTPFFLYTESGTVPGLMAYMCILLAGTTAIFLIKGWRSLLFTTFFGAWLVLGLAFQTDTLVKRISLQTGTIITWLLFWLVPVIREILVERSPNRWSRPSLGPAGRTLGFDEAAFPQRDVALISLLAVTIALYVSREVWAVGDVLWGCAALSAAAVYGIAAWRLKRLGGVAVLATAHMITAAVLAATASALLFEDSTLLVLWALQATVMHAVARRLGNRSVGISAHLLFGMVVLWLLQRTVEGGHPDLAVWNVRALADAIAIAAVLGSSWLVEKEAVPLYRIAAHFGVLAWIWREFTSLPAGEGIVTATWGAYALAILFFVKGARNVGLATLCLAVAKLVLFDLRQVEPIWRILLFLSFGGVFLAIGYFHRNLWEDEGDSS